MVWEEKARKSHKFHGLLLSLTGRLQFGLEKDSFCGILNKIVNKRRTAERVSGVPVELLEPSPKDLSKAGDEKRLSYEMNCILDAQGVDRETYEAIHRYTKSSEEINRYMRDHAFDLGMRKNVNSNDDIAKYCLLIDGYLNTGELLKDMVLYRGTSIDDFVNSFWLDETSASNFLQDCYYLNDNAVETKYKNQILLPIQFISTSRVYDKALEFIKYPKQCIIKMNAPKGTAARFIGNISEYPDEEEILLSVNTKMQFNKIVTDAAGQKAIYLNIISSKKNRGYPDQTQRISAWSNLNRAIEGD